MDFSSPSSYNRYVWLLLKAEMASTKTLANKNLFTYIAVVSSPFRMFARGLN